MARALAGQLPLVLFLMLALATAPGVAAGGGWSLTLNPTKITVAIPTTIQAVITNKGGPDGTRELGCVRITIPLSFTIQSATVTSRPPNTKWAASIGIGSVTIASPSGGDRLPPDGKTSVTTAITVLPITSGTYAWTGNAYRQGDCTDGYNEPIAVKVEAKFGASSSPNPTAVPTILPTALPTILPTPRPTPTPTPMPMATAAPVATATGAPAGTPVAAATPGGGPGGPADPTSAAQIPVTRPSASAGDDPPDARSSASPAIGAALVLPGGGPDDGSTGAGEPDISLTSGFETPFGDGFEWAVPGLVLSVPGLLIVLVAIGAQAFGAAAWLPVVRRRIGDFELDRRNEGSARGAGTGA